MPGTVSILMRKAGTYRLCSTSTLVMRSFTGVSTGTTSTLPRLPPGYSNTHDHMRAATFTSMAPSGTVRRAL